MRKHFVTATNNLPPLLLAILALWVAMGGQHAPGAPLTAALAGLLAAVWLGANLRLSRQLRHVARGADLLRGQDFSSRLRNVGNPGLDSIVSLFNTLMTTLRNEHLKLCERHHFLSLLIEASPMAIEIYDYDQLRITLANPAARRIITPDLRSAIAGLRPGESRVVRLSGSRIYKCTMLSFREEGFLRPFMLVETLTDEIRHAERTAFEKVIRLISHEVNNTIGGVVTLTDALIDAEQGRPEGADPDVVAALGSCSQRSRSLSRFIKEYVDLVKMPSPRLIATDLPALLRGLMPFVRQLIPGATPTVSVELDTGNADCMVMIDPTLFEQVVVNIVKNAIESCTAAGGGAVAVKLMCGPAMEHPSLEVSDSGSGISPETAARLFSPFYSTKAGGRGLGLMFAAEVLDRHGFSYSLQTYHDGLTRFTITFDGN